MTKRCKNLHANSDIKNIKKSLSKNILNVALLSAVISIGAGNTYAAEAPVPTLDKLNAAGESVIDSGYSLNPSENGDVNIYNITETKVYYDLVEDENGNKEWKQVDAPTETSKEVIQKELSVTKYNADIKPDAVNTPNVSNPPTDTDIGIYSYNNTITAEVDQAINGGIVTTGDTPILGVYGDFINNEIRTNDSGNNKNISGGIIHTKTSIEGIYGDFINNNAYGANWTEGGAISNQGNIGEITGNFIQNSITTGRYGAWGGAISTGWDADDGTHGGIDPDRATHIGSINGLFYGNTATAYTNAHGGAVAIRAGSTVDEINADFIANAVHGGTAGTAYGAGGAIENQASTIGIINGDFINNLADSEGGDTRGGAIDNQSAAQIGTINGDFIGNKVTGQGIASSSGGAIYNGDDGSKIGEINGNFINNSAASELTQVQGGAIANVDGAEITSIKGDFIGNTVSGNRYVSRGGAIYNNSNTSNVSSKIGTIEGVFKNNSVTNSSIYNALGGAIYNNGSYSTDGSFTTIDSIKGLFDGNIAKSEQGMASGGAIYNYNYAKINNIEADFINNKTEAQYGAFGGAIANESVGTIDIINGDFINNSVVSSQAGASGGAITNYGHISSLTGDFKANTATGINASGGAFENVGSIDTISSNFYNNIANGKNSAAGGAIVNTQNLGEGMDYVKGEFIGNEARSENYAVGGAVANVGITSGNSSLAIIGKLTENSGIDGIFRNNEAVAADSGISLMVEGGVGLGGGIAIEQPQKYAAGGAIYNEGIIKNIKGDFVNNVAQVSFNDNAALAEGGALLANTDTLNTDGINYDYIYSQMDGESGISTMSLEGGGIGASGMPTDIVKFNIKVEDETHSYYLPVGLIEGGTAASGLNTIGTELDIELTPEQFEELKGQIEAELGALGIPVATDLESLGAMLYDKQIMKISGNFDSNKALATNSGTARGGAISFVANNHGFEKIEQQSQNQNSIQTMAAVVTPTFGYKPVSHNKIIVDGEVVADFISKNYMGDKLGYVNLLPEREYIIENSTFTNNIAKSENGNAYGGAVSIVNNSGQISAYGENELVMSEEEFINSFGGYDATTKEEALANLNAQLDAMREEGLIVDTPEDGISEEFASAQTPKDTFIFKNTTFVNNTAESKGEDVEAHGGAIYSQSNVTIQADNAESLISDNKAITNGNVVDEAIYLDNNNSEEPIILELDTINNGKIQINDKINGNVQYELSLIGDGTGQTVFNNSVNNAHIITNDGSNTLLTQETHWDGNDLTMNGGTLSFLNNSVGIASLNNVVVTKDTNFIADVDLANKQMDRFTAQNYGQHTGNVVVSGMNLLTDAVDDHTAVYFAQPGLKYNVTNGTGELPGSYQTEAFTPIYRYLVSYDNQHKYNGQGDGGYFLFTKGGSNTPAPDPDPDVPGTDPGDNPGSGSGNEDNPGAGDNPGIIPPPISGGGFPSGSGNPSDSFNPAVLVAPTANLAAAQAAMNEAFKYVFEHADAFTQLPKYERYAMINANKYALSTDYNDNLWPLDTNLHNKGAWVRPYTTFETMNLKNGPDVDAITYGTLVGFDTDFHEHRNGWHSVTTGYLGYNGSQLSYSGVDTSMNGGLIGMTETFYKGNFWTALTLSAGASVGSSSTMYGNEDFTSLLAGIGSKTGYNFEFKEGKFILQPILFMSYTFVNTFDYTNAAGVKIDADPMHAIQLNPQVRFIANLKNGWQPYASVGMVWNLLNESSVSANNVRLPEMSIKPYVEYGLGVQKRFKDKFTGFLQAMVRNGGRNGVALTAGFRWAIGNESNPDNTEKKEIKGL